MSTSVVPDPWGEYSPTLRQSLWIDAIRLAAPWVRRPLQRYFRKNIEPGWSSPIDVVVRGTRFRSHFRDNAHEYKLLFQGRRLDHWHLQSLRPFLRPDMSFVDVGANCGFFSLTAARAVGDRCRILAIEPNPEMARRLRENVRLNRTSSILVREVAIGASHGLAAGTPDAGNYGSSGYRKVEGAAETGPHVPMMPLFDVIESAGLDRINVLKVDIEGHEDQALSPFFRAAPERLWPEVIALEVSHRSRWQSDLLDQLHWLRYRVIGRRRVDLILRRAEVGD
jgi:FkbM family methyltransferase